MRRHLFIAFFVLLGCSAKQPETLEVEMDGPPENPADPVWLALFQKAADSKCGGAAQVYGPLNFRVAIDDQPAKMIGRFTCK